MQEDEEVGYRNNPIALTGRSIDLLMTQSQQDRLLATLRSKSNPVIHISLAFDRRFRQVALQSKLNANILQGAQSIALKDKEVDALMKRINNPSPQMSTRQNDLQFREELHEIVYEEEDPDIAKSGESTLTRKIGNSASTFGGASKFFREESSLSIEAPLPEVNQHVLNLVGSMRTHLDLFSEVECYFVMSVAYLEAAIQLTAEQEKFHSGQKRQLFVHDRCVCMAMHKYPFVDDFDLNSIACSNTMQYIYRPVVRRASQLRKRRQRIPMDLQTAHTFSLESSLGPSPSYWLCPLPRRKTRGAKWA